MRTIFTPLIAAFALSTTPALAETWPSQDGAAVLKNFAFVSGETLPEVRMHYTTLGTPHKDKKGQIDNAIMVLHGTGGSGKQFLQPHFADEPASRSTLRSITSSCQTISDMAARPSRATGCAWLFRNMTMTIWSKPNTGC